LNQAFSQTISGRSEIEKSPTFFVPSVPSVPVFTQFRFSPWLRVSVVKKIFPADRFSFPIYAGLLRVREVQS